MIAAAGLSRPQSQAAALTDLAARKTGPAADVLLAMAGDPVLALGSEARAAADAAFWAGELAVDAELGAVASRG